MRESGRGVRIAIIDTGIHAEHPHVGGIAGGIAIDAHGCRHLDIVDRVGHGTAVAAAVKEKAPEAELYAVKVVDDRLSTGVDRLVSAVDWAIEAGMHIANLSLGTSRSEHERLLSQAVERARAHRLLIVAARDDEGVRFLPGSLPGVLAVQVDWSCPRNEYRVATIDGGLVFKASGLPRPIPGVSPSRNLSGVSFAVANMTGFAARTLVDGGAAATAATESVDAVIRVLACEYSAKL
jgi:subtilisin family serine protease